jgi:hypothetical protein
MRNPATSSGDGPSLCPAGAAGFFPCKEFTGIGDFAVCE